MKKAIYFFFFFFIHMYSVSLYAYNLRKINNRDNLPNTSITSIYQDKRGLMWIGTSGGLNIYDGRNLSVYYSADSSHFLTGNLIDKIVGTNDNVLWIHTFYGLNKINRSTNTLELFDMFNRVSFSGKDSRDNLFIIQGNNSIYYTLKDKKQFDQIYVPNLTSNDVLDFFVGSNDKMWIFRSNGNNLCYGIQVDQQGNITLKQEKGYQHSERLLYCFNDLNGTIFLVDKKNRLYEFDTDTQESTLISDLNDQIIRNGVITSIVKFHDDYFFGFKTDGLFILRKQEQAEYIFEKVPINCGISCLLKDKYQDMVWIGTDAQGVYTYSIDQYSIRSTLLSDFTLKMKQPVKALFLDKDNTLWIGSKGDGILKIYDYDPNKNIIDSRIAYLTTSNSQLIDNSVNSFSKSRHNNFWIGTENGLNYYVDLEKTIRRIPLSDQGTDIKYVQAIYEQDSTLWISSVGMGIVQAKIRWTDNIPSLKMLRRYTVKKEDPFSNYFFSIYPENDTTIWFANRGEGAFKINTVTSQIETIKFDEHTLNEVNVITKDRQNNYLMGTNFGFVKYSPGKRTILNETNGFPSNTIHCILPESNIDFWLSTNRGVVCYNSVSGSFRTFDVPDGLSVVEFSDGASYKDKRSGTLFFGGINGFITINRNYYDDSQDYMPPVYFDRLTIFGKDYNIYEFLSKEETGTVLKLSHHQNFFSVSFTAIDHLNGNNYAYYYKLDGANDQWIDNGNSNMLSFTNFNPGKYKLSVKYYNKVLDKESYTYSINMQVLPPWYQSGWACFAYLLFSVLLVLSVIKAFMLRNKRKRTDMLQKLEQQHKEEIYESKLQFFTNIAHEFCTPLTLIYGPCSRILSHKNVDHSLEQYARIIQQNAERLNALIQDLIEFQRIETGYKKPQITKLPVSEIVTQIVNSFAHLAESKSIEFEKDIAPSITWNSDKNFITAIITNLLSNAFKYTPDNKAVSIKMSIITDHLNITISNTGKGIKEEDIAIIFDRYNILHNFEYQDNSSWARNGLGLAISYNMISLLEGTIAIESIPDEWTHFKIKLPLPEVSTNESIIYNVPEINIKSEDGIIPTLPKYSFDALKPSMMVIDDEPEIRWFISDIFIDEFNVIPVSSAAEALAGLYDFHPDIILCDIIMQGLDGISLTKELKSNDKTAHIPLILISGKHEVEEQIEGINAGAEFYITKPFNVAYLKSSVKQLIGRKETLKDYFASPLSAFELESGKLTHKEHKKLIKDIVNIINKNIQNKDLSVNFIAAKMNMSNRSLYRKIGEISDISITDMIHDCKLHIARNLLVKSKLTVDEIVFKSGFTNRTSFYRIFSKKYGHTPTEYRSKTTNQ